MSSREITLIGYVVIILFGVGVEIYARRTEAIPTVGVAFRWALQTHSGRIALFAAWAWMGLHFLG